VTTNSSMEARPEPIHLRAVAQEDGAVWVILGDKMVVSNSTDYVSQTLQALKVAGHDPETQVIIQSVSGNPAWNGAIKHHPHCA
jgi:hypothetical protein